MWALGRRSRPSSHPSLPPVRALLRASVLESATLPLQLLCLLYRCRSLVDRPKRLRVPSRPRLWSRKLQVAKYQLLACLRSKAVSDLVSTLPSLLRLSHSQGRLPSPQVDTLINTALSRSRLWPLTTISNINNIISNKRRRLSGSVLPCSPIPASLRFIFVPERLFVPCICISHCISISL